ncbi:hypothetical protein H7K45_00765 [Mycobacterium yunnanensis]|uniref:Uncharacterized protein n=1 Tax=Mycobacterium yunnanensis TaxID=368477 RepID=A0A9X2YU64_9MYCO|nr:hypothetical protein [Mycobacterium yunnanensis]MCV7419065.1 hypothetical protein [Mycobacterium yunnanensis]
MTAEVGAADWDVLAGYLDLLSPEEALELMTCQPASDDGFSVAQKTGS